MDIVRLIKDAHENAIDKGFYDCPECGGAGCITPDVDKFCYHCNGTGIDPNKNIGELLMLIVSELGEALEAHRNKRFSDKKRFEWLINDTGELKDTNNSLFVVNFESYIKDTFEDEIADVFIRLFDLCGYLGIEPGIENVSYFQNLKDKNIGNQLFDIVTTITDFNRGSNSGEIDRLKIVTWRALFQLNNFCTVHNIPIEKHIEAKMAYNRTREHKHGKAY